jgi:hypothetical protein
LLDDLCDFESQQKYPADRSADILSGAVSLGANHCSFRNQECINHGGKIVARVSERERHVKKAEASNGFSFTYGFVIRCAPVGAASIKGSSGITIQAIG